MGVTIHYRGTMDDMALVEEMEDRVVDLALALGGRATVWRSFAIDDPSRSIRGLTLEMAPGQETLSLLVSPEGHLINLFDIEQAEKQPLIEPPYCHVKTQFGSVQGHVAIVYLLDALKFHYISNLDVDDESGFYTHRDPRIRSQEIKQLGDAIRGLGDSLQTYGLSDEAAEDPEILMARIERVAQLVVEKMRKMATFPGTFPTRHADGDDWCEPTLEEEVEVIGRLHRRNQQRCERMIRRVADATAAGISNEESLVLALQEAGLEPPGANARDDGATEVVAKVDGSAGLSCEPCDGPRSWRGHLEWRPMDESCEIESGIESHAEHPTVQRAEQLLLEITNMDARPSRSSSFAGIAARGLIDMVGGLVQATSGDQLGRPGRAHVIVQLKRAMRGHAFCRGAIVGLRGTNQIDQATCDRFHDELAAILESIHDLMAASWDENAPP